MSDQIEASDLLVSVRLVHGADTCDPAGRPLSTYTCDYHQGYQDGLERAGGCDVDSCGDDAPFARKHDLGDGIWVVVQCCEMHFDRTIASPPSPTTDPEEPRG